MKRQKPFQSLFLDRTIIYAVAKCFREVISLSLGGLKNQPNFAVWPSIVIPVKSSHPNLTTLVHLSLIVNFRYFLSHCEYFVVNYGDHASNLIRIWHLKTRSPTSSDKLHKTLNFKNILIMVMDHASCSSGAVFCNLSQQLRKLLSNQ